MREPEVRSERISVTVAEAREIILGSVRPLGAETIGLTEAGGRVLAEEIRAEVSIPPHDNSAMDGFAVRSEDVRSVPATLAVVEDLPAGRRSQRKLGPGEAARIMTGAAIPEGADAVVMIEETEGEGDRVTINKSAAKGGFVRRAGSDVSPGTLIAESGTVIGPALVGMLSAIGRTALCVASRPRVAILATGDELVEPDRLEPDGRIVSSNSYSLRSALRTLGAEPVYLGIAPDEPEQIAARFRQALACDAVVSTGGVSVGDRDWIKQVLADLGGDMRLWRVNMRPGAPLAFAVIDGKPVFGLPGNPVSTLVTFEQFVRPTLLRMMGHTRVFRPVESAILAETFEKPPGRLYFVRVVVEERDGQRYAVATGDQTSNVLLSMVRADGLAIIPAEAERVAGGSEVLVQLLGRDDLRADPGF
ncbi:MAG: gephyrin-like molybdotransferase Glp [Myxococcota bacterium]